MEALYRAPRYEGALRYAWIANWRPVTGQAEGIVMNRPYHRVENDTQQVVSVVSAERCPVTLRDQLSAWRTVVQALNRSEWLPCEATADGSCGLESWVIPVGVVVVVLAQGLSQETTQVSDSCRAGFIITNQTPQVLLTPAPNVSAMGAAIFSDDVLAFEVQEGEPRTAAMADPRTPAVEQNLTRRLVSSGAPVDGAPWGLLLDIAQFAAEVCRLSSSSPQLEYREEEEDDGAHVHEHDHDHSYEQSGGDPRSFGLRALHAADGREWPWMGALCILVVVMAVDICRRRRSRSGARDQTLISSTGSELTPVRMRA